ncbi:hypothetical protein CRI93_03125 [Longimonas halophila]|uniref:Uncharacterized protein n=1 Tax=Longimonas halophila TaxID=1469170 RepID=A0A2H3P073_9BACT|nr:hypothetical protein [Longimonas halophila]PEN08763.1 hypothetical protein CRI93_03125 [Longimonas halophila]
MKSMSYELLVRHAHAYETRAPVKRFGHPKANADLYKQSRLHDAKEGLRYAFDTLTSAVLGTCSLSVEERDRLNRFISRLDEASDVVETSEVMDDFRSSVFDKYFDINGRVVPKLEC